MTFSMNPEMQTYETQTISAVYDLDIPPGATTTSQSYGMRNVVPIKRDGQQEFGESRYVIDSWKLSAAGSIRTRGWYVWEKTAGTLYFFLVASDSTNTKVYTATSSGGIPASLLPVTTLTNDGTTPVRFVEFIDATNTKKLVMVDGIEGYVFTSNAAGTKITDADFPTPHVPFPIFLDGYLFLAKAGTGDIYNSDLNDPAIWTAGSFLSAEMYPDDIQALVKIANYLVAIGTQSVEYFYDAANPTASPLARIDGLTLPFGTTFPNSIASSKDKVILLTNNNDGSVSLRIIEGTKTSEIPCPFVDLLMNSITAGNMTYSTVRGWFARQSGNLLYGFKFNGELQTATPANQPSFVYCLDTQKWVEFTAGSDTYSFPVDFTAPTTTGTVVTYVAGHIQGQAFYGIFNPVPSVILGSTGYIDSIRIGGPSSYTISQTITTSIQEFGSLNLKTASRFGIQYTSVNSTGNSAQFSVSWDDTGTYGSFNAPVAMGYSTGNFYDFPTVTQLGSFRQRAFKITYSGPIQVRWKMFELKLNRHIQ